MDLKNPTRTESLLANIAGYTGVPVPDMKNATRSERLLKEILDNGGGGGGDVTKEYVDNAIANAVADIDDDISALSDTVADKVDKVNGKGLSTNDYTDADKALVQDSPIITTSTTSPISTANGKPRKLTIYGKSEVVDGAIKSAGEGWATVDLGTLNYVSGADGTYGRYYTTGLSNIIKRVEGSLNLLCPLFTPTTALTDVVDNPSGCMWLSNAGNISFSKNGYTSSTDFKAAMSGVLLCYQLADPTQGNTIAVKTDNGSGVDGTMATFTTGTPLYGVSDTVRNNMTWNGTSSEITKICAEIDLGTLNWEYVEGWHAFRSYDITNAKEHSRDNILPLLNAKGYTAVGYMSDTQPNYSIVLNSTYHAANTLAIRDTDYTDATVFKTAMSGVKLIYELATPTTTPLTQTENESIAGLKTYSPSTSVAINDASDYSIEAYANTPNGQAISDMQPTRSPLLTLTASGWTNNAQTVTYEHNTGKRNSIDVEPASIKAWTAAGILATSETASTITFECDTVPTADLSFRVTSMEVR